MSRDFEVSVRAEEEERPRGRDEIRKAVLDAADHIFASRRPSLVSVREVAALAGVNHALIHRHFGTKENLVREVLERADSRLEASWAHLAEAEEVFGFMVRHREVYQHALLVFEGAVMDRAVEAPFSRLLDGLVDRLESEGSGASEARSAAIAAVSLLLGWATFGDYLSAAAAVADEEGQVESTIESTLHAMFRSAVS